MNDYNVLTTNAEKEKADIVSYKFLEEEGEFLLNLDCRAWGKKMNLGCYFTDEQGNKIVSYCWRREVADKEIYAPKKSGIDFSKVQDDTKWKCTFSRNSKGKLDWILAEQV